MSGTIAFVASETSVGEAGRQALVTIGRTGDLSQPVTVTYAVTADTATLGADYLQPPGSITMAAGQDRATFVIPIVNDALSEATESMVASIIGVSSGVFGTPRTTRINILDDENPATDPAVPQLVSDYIVTEERTVAGLTQPMDFVFSPSDPDILYIAEKGGRIRVFDLETDSFRPDFVDLSAAVNDWQDRGLMNIALHPDFPSQPYVYAYYVVDPPEASGLGGFAGPDGGGNRYAYLSRFTADMTANGLQAVPGSEVVLVGGAGTSYLDVAGAGAVEANGSANLGLPASDRYVAAGDPTPPTVINGYKQDYIKVDSLSHAGGALAFGPDGMLYVGIGDGALPTLADPRTPSVQDLDSLAGKVLRIDPITGAGLAGNPFASGVPLTHNAAKVWQLGLRNPFSMVFDPDGRLFITDTGWNSYEEINQGGPGANFGWPFYEGGDFGDLLKTPIYRDFAQAGPFYQAVANGSISITAPFRAFAHADGAPGFQFQAIVGGDAIYDGSAYPAELRNDYFFIDFNDAEVYSVDVHDRRDAKFVYSPAAGGMPVYLSQGPDGRIWYADIAKGELGRLQIDGRRVFVDLDAAQKTYLGTHRPEIYVIDAAADSTPAQLDRITAFDVAAGDRVDFTGTGWGGGDVSFTRFNVGQADEWTQAAGPGGFALRIDAPLPALTGAFLFATPGNLAPTAANDAATTTEAKPVTVNVLANDGDPDGQALHIVGFTPLSASGSGLIEQVGNALVYKPRPGFIGSDSFTYAVSDGNAIDVATVTVTVAALPRRVVQLGPGQADYAGTPDADIYVVVSATDSTRTLLDRIMSFDVATGDRVDFTAMGWDADDLVLHTLSYGKPTEHTRIDGPNGFSLWILKKKGLLDGAFVFGEPPANRPPTAVDDTAATTGTGPVTVNVLANDADPDGNPLSVGAFDATSAHGGTVARSGNALVYTPASGFHGVDSFDYVVSDGQLTDVGRVSVTVPSAPPPPTGNVVQLGPGQADYAGTAGADIYVVDASSDSTRTLLDRIMSFDVAAGDRVDVSAMGWDADDLVLHTLSYGKPTEHTRIDGPSGFSLWILKKKSLLAGAFIFDEPPANRPPTALDDTAAGTGPVTVSVLTNDSDPDGNPLSVSSFDAVSAHGGAVARAGNALVYTPASGFHGVDSFDYVVSDGQLTDVGRVTVTVPSAPPPSLGNVEQLGPAQADYAGTAGADFYVVDAVSDSTRTLLDRIMSFDVAAGDRVDVTAMGWDADDLVLHTLSYGKPTEHTRIDGPNGFSLWILKKKGLLAGAFIFGDDAATATAVAGFADVDSFDFEEAATPPAGRMVHLDPDGLEPRINETFGDLDGAFLFGGDTLI